MASLSAGGGAAGGGSMAGGAPTAKLFIGGLPYHITEDQVKELVGAFGALRSFYLIKDPATGMSKGYGFFEYEDPEIDAVAIGALHNLDLAGKNITVRRATGTPGGGPSSGGMAGQPQLLQQLQPSPHLSTAPPTRILVLENMVTADELKDDQEYAEIVEDVRGEVAKFGSVLSLVIPRPPPDGSEAAGVGKIFVEYSDANSSAKAGRALAGREFAGRTVKANYHDEAKFAAADFA